MVDVGRKAVTRRVARAGARVWMAARTMALLQEQALPKGDVLAVARIAGIMAAKRTSDLVPLCHPLPLNQVEVVFTLVPEECRVDIECSARTDGKTGVEMEAITGAAVAAITIYDMCKAVDRAMVIGDIRLLEKTGGKEEYRLEETAELMPAEGTAEAPEASASSAAAGRASRPPSRERWCRSTSARARASARSRWERVVLKEEWGIEGDGHAGVWHRQVSLLAEESIAKMVAKGLDVGPGDFAENITTRGIELPVLPLGTRLELGTALVEVTQIGKVCHDHCAIYYQAGDCVMPKEGIFVRVLRGGEVAPGDAVRVVSGGGA